MTILELFADDVLSGDGDDGDHRTNKDVRDPHPDLPFRRKE
jgi:hypothetical protein